MLPNAIQRLYTILSLLIVVAMNLKFYTGPSHRLIITEQLFSTRFSDCLFLFLLIKESKAVMAIPLWVFWHHLWAKFPTIWHPPVLELFRSTF